MGSVAEKWNATYFGNRLSPGALAALDPLNQAKADAQALVNRTFRLMQVARLDPTDLPARTTALLASVTSAVPSAWDGAVPPITMAGRHQKIDHYIATNPWHRPTGEPVLVDLGCGFPPFTAIDSAARLTGWRIIGADPSFPQYLVYDDQGNYACFDDHQNLRYHQHGHLDPNSAVTRTRFRHLLHHLLPLLPNHDAGELADVVHDRARLVRNPLRRYEIENHEIENHEIENHETGNLALVQAGVGSFVVEGGADVIRCMNVLMYFDQSFRRTCLEWAKGMLRPGGLVICGSNWARSTHSRCTVYQQQDHDLAPREFAFSIDNLRPIGIAPWYALHDDNLENLCNAEAVGIIRSDEAFRRRFDARLDALFAQTGLCRRGADGYLRGPEDNAPEDNAPDDRAPPVDLENCVGQPELSDSGPSSPASWCFAPVPRSRPCPQAWSWLSLAWSTAPTGGRSRGEDSRNTGPLTPGAQLSSHRDPPRATAAAAGRWRPVHRARPWRTRCRTALSPAEGSVHSAPRTAHRSPGSFV